MLADVKAGNAANLATLSVAVREIRNLIEATAVPESDGPLPVDGARSTQREIALG